MDIWISSQRILKGQDGGLLSLFGARDVDDPCQDSPTAAGSLSSKATASQRVVDMEFEKSESIFACSRLSRGADVLISKDFLPDGV